MPGDSPGTAGLPAANSCTHREEMSNLVSFATSAWLLDSTISVPVCSIGSYQSHWMNVAMGGDKSCRCVSVMLRELSEKSLQAHSVSALSKMRQK